MMAQVGGRPRATLIAAGMLFVIGLLPGMPRLPFFVLATIMLLAAGARRATLEHERRGARRPSAEAELGGSRRRPSRGRGAPQPRTSGRGAAAASTASRLEIGYRLIPLVQDGSGARHARPHRAAAPALRARARGSCCRRCASRTTSGCAPNGYRMLIGGQEVAARRDRAGRATWPWTAARRSGADRGQARPRDPAFGLPALVDRRGPARRGRAARLHGDRPDQRAGHAPLRGRSAPTIGEMLSRDDVKELVENAKKTAPAVVEELIPERDRLRRDPGRPAQPAARGRADPQHAGDPRGARRQRRAHARTPRR